MFYLPGRCPQLVADSKRRPGTECLMVDVCWHGAKDTSASMPEAWESCEQDNLRAIPHGLGKPQSKQGRLHRVGMVWIVLRAQRQNRTAHLNGDVYT